jgi:hypothetical protein
MTTGSQPAIVWSVSQKQTPLFEGGAVGGYLVDSLRLTVLRLISCWYLSLIRSSSTAAWLILILAARSFNSCLDCSVIRMVVDALRAILLGQL